MLNPNTPSYCSLNLNLLIIMKDYQKNNFTNLTISLENSRIFIKFATIFGSTYETIKDNKIHYQPRKCLS